MTDWSFASSQWTALRSSRRWLVGLGAMLLCILATALLAAVAFRLHFNLSAIGSVYLLLVVFTALRWGFGLATVISVAAVFCMNYLFVPPIFEFQIADPENWVAVATFETAALVVSGLSSQLRMRAAQLEMQRARTAKLYQLSGAILLIDGRRSTSEQLLTLIQDAVQAQSVDLWVVCEFDSETRTHGAVEISPAHETYLEGTDSEDVNARDSRRVLRVGTTPIGGMVLRGWATDSLLADAVASLTAVAFERTRSVTQDDGKTTIEVANGGSSIKPQEREWIFERFYRGIEAVHGPSGTGLGLSIVKKTAEAHGGRVWVECEDDTTRFFFVLEHFKGVKHG